MNSLLDSGVVPDGVVALNEIAHTKDIGEGDLDALLIGDVDSGTTRIQLTSRNACADGTTGKTAQAADRSKS